MTTSHEQRKEAAHARFEELGAARVKEMLAAEAFPNEWNSIGAEWLAGKDKPKAAE
jgi:hypothetical protein